MFIIIKEYFEWLYKKQFNKSKFRIIKHFGLLFSSIFIISFLSDRFFIQSFNVSSNNLFYNENLDFFITLFSIINGFLLSGISIVLAGGEMNSKKLEKLKQKYKITNIEEYIKSLKQIILYNVLLIFCLIIILAILVSILKLKYIGRLSIITLFLFFLILFFLYQSIKRFIIFEKGIDLNI